MISLLQFLLVAVIIVFAIVRMSPDSRLGKVLAPVAAGVVMFAQQIWEAIQGLM